MRFLNNLTRREKTILYVTVAIGLAAGVYFGYLEGVIEGYQTVSADLAAQTERLKQQQSILAEGSKVDRDFAEIEGSLPKTREGKDPAMVFSEQMEELFRNLSLPTPNFGKRSEEEIPNAPGFSYQGIFIQRSTTDLATLAKLLKSLAQKNLKIRSLTIRLTALQGELEFTLEPAQVIRNQDVAKEKPKSKPAATAPDEEL